jgi:hypothetical protein
MTQYQRIGKLLTRKRGATAMELTTVAGTVSCHSRLSEMKRHGWIITRRPVPGRNYGTYHGLPPEYIEIMGER